MASADGSQWLTELVARMKAGWPAGRWEWDGRFQCALTTLNQANEAQGRASLLASLPGTWTRATLGEAPPLVQRICERTGGLKGAQMVYGADLDGDLAYCLWWPWGDGATFSVRVGVISTDPGRDLTPDLRTAFGVR
ncbi:MAG TPA: hypothetical protein VGG33_27590 [Polyangia bacterium]